jgi:TRAP transporter TAXI family solute receptor
MTSMRKTLILACSVIAALSMLNSDAQAADPSTITFTGGGPQGRWFLQASLFSKILGSELPQTSFSAVTGKGNSVGLIKKVNANQAQLGFAQAYHVDDALKHNGPFKNAKTDYSQVVTWFSLDVNIMNVIGDASIKNFAGLKGKKISIGQKGSGDDRECRILLNGHGITDDNANFVYATRKDGVAQLTNGQIDAFCSPLSRNNRGFLAGLFSARPIGTHVDYIPQDPKALAKITAKHPQYSVDSVGEPAFDRPAGGKVNMDRMAFTMVVTARRDLPEDFVYKLTKLLFSNWDKVQAQAPWLKDQNFPSYAASSAGFVPYHPGAAKYYKEKGFWKK